jgi:hypothetical protein
MGTGQNSSQLNYGECGLDALAADTPRYLLARYIPDILRDEPRNIGVILWTPKAIGARFIGETAPGQVDLRSVPPFVNVPSAYAQWVNYWRSQMQYKRLKPLGGGPSVWRSNPAFLDALQSSNHGNFQLVLAGIVMDEIMPTDIEDAVEQVFGTLVSRETDDELVTKDSSARLVSTFSKICKTTGVDRHSNFIRNYPVRCHIRLPASAKPSISQPFPEKPGVITPLRNLDDYEQVIRFNFGYGNGTPRKLYQYVSLPANDLERNRIVRSSAWMFEQVLIGELITIENIRAVVYVPRSQYKSDDVRDALNTIRPYATVMNLAETTGNQALSNELGALAKSPPLAHDDVLPM